MQSTILTGTLPVRPFDSRRFFGTIRADGQAVRVAALAANPDGTTVLLSLTGFDTSVSAVLATLFKRETILFVPDEDLHWAGPRRLARMGLNYKQISAAIDGTREKHFIAFPYAAHIADGALHPPQIPRALTRQGREDAATNNRNPTDDTDDRIPTPRFVFGNADEETPNFDAVLGHLIALRVIVIRSPDLRPLMLRWVEQFWTQGLERSLITPLPALGIRAWQISGDLVQWNAIITDGLRQGRLPTTLNGNITAFPQAMERAA